MQTVTYISETDWQKNLNLKNLLFVMKNNKRGIMNKKGFTLIELIIVIVIVGILSVIAVPVYRGYIEKAIMSEGKTLLGAIGKAELAYHVQHRRFLAIEKTGHSSDLDVDARGGKYFNKFYTDLSGGGASIERAKSSVDKVAKVSYNSLRNSVYIEVYGKYKGRDLMLSATQFANGYLYIGERFSEPDEPVCDAK